MFQLSSRKKPFWDFYWKKREENNCWIILIRLLFFPCFTQMIMQQATNWNILNRLMKAILILQSKKYIHQNWTCLTYCTCEILYKRNCKKLILFLTKLLNIKIHPFFIFFSKRNNNLFSKPIDTNIPSYICMYK